MQVQEDHLQDDPPRMGGGGDYDDGAIYLLHGSLTLKFVLLCRSSAGQVLVSEVLSGVVGSHFQL
jgi:hypothetical protein